MSLDDRANIFTMSNADLCQIFIGMHWVQQFRQIRTFALKDKMSYKLMFSEKKTFEDSFNDLFYVKKEDSSSSSRAQEIQSQRRL